MFEDKYKKVLNEIKAPENSAEKAMAKTKKRKDASYLKSWVAVAACLAIILGGAGIFAKTRNVPENYDDYFASTLPHPRPNNSVTLTPTEPKSYKAVIGTVMALIEKVKNNEVYDKLTNMGGVDLGYGAIDEAEDGMIEDVVDNFVDSFKDSYTDTNNQVSGVQEADIIKTDGKYIYALNGNELSVYSADNGDISFVSSADIENGMYCKSLILYKSKLAVIYNQSRKSYDYDGKQLTVTDIYTVSEDGNVEKDSRFVQSGYFVSCRERGGKLYVITTYDGLFTYGDIFRNETEITEDTVKDRLPVSGIDKGSTVKAENILIPEYLPSMGFTVVSGLDLTTQEFNTAALMDVGTGVYMDTDTLYVYSEQYVYNAENDRYNRCTTVNRFSLENGNPKHTGTVCVDGTYLNQYSFDEYNGYLRIAVNRPSTNDNAVIILDKDLNTVSEVTGMGKGEQVKSVRFYGETAYVVTFRQTDPLYALDLSDPENPVILSELKIPGFSTYLQKFGEDMLFGFGYDADENTGWRKGLKLSMFDISDAKNTCEKHTLLLSENTYFSDDVLKAVVVDATRNLIMFPYRIYGNETIYDETANTTYTVYTEKLVYAAYLYGENGFELLGEAVYTDDFIS
ncbi:MAG: beta-propeller domain-containing protein, partial [Clostridia bacterium]|nr:beta-propeller domain-containing protein [Clostridia bacterium]